MQRTLYYVNAQSLREKLLSYYTPNASTSKSDGSVKVTYGKKISPKGAKNKDVVYIENGNTLPNPDIIETEPKWKYLILDFSAVNYVDTTAIKTLLEV